MYSRILLIIAFLCCIIVGAVDASTIDDLETLLRDNAQVQEKVYVHTDNSAYFVGDTLWYKAYVVRADDLCPTNMSKLLYVELLTPDGYLVERQHIVVSDKGFTCGQFILEDSLYSGFYEIRAYTRWQLNFNVTERDYTRDDALKFYGKQAAKDFYRDWEGLYSRVVPVYQKPREKGNYVDRYMSHRPKTRILKDKEFLTMSFYPEGGQLIEGVPCNLAFEVKDNHGENFDLEGTLSNGMKIKTQHLGMGQMTVTPTETPLTATFSWRGKDYTFTLPQAKKQGVALSFDAEKKTVSLFAKGMTPAAYAVLCRGRLMTFQRLSSNKIQLQQADLQTGVNELIIYDDNAQPLASRLFFVNNGDYGKPVNVTLTASGAEVGAKTTVDAYAPIDVKVDAGEQHPTTISLAIRDAQTDERGYDNGNIMTDMLLSSELKGFIAYPAYYFESNDAKHLSDLDLLMKVQGWRRYKRVDKIRYKPEHTLTFEGTVMTIPAEAGQLELDDLISNMGKKAKSVSDYAMEEIDKVSGTAVSTDITLSMSDETTEEDDTFESDDNSSETEMEWLNNKEDKLGSGRVRHAVLVEAEISKGGDIAGAVTRTDRNGRFIIQIPPFYGKSSLFVKAYTHGDSINKNMQSRLADKNFANERAFPDFFVKQDVFFPIFSQPYSWYQVNSPDLLFVDEEDTDAAPTNGRLSGIHQLQTVVVKSRRRGRRGIDMKRPAIVKDAYQLYNEMSDRGLMFGVADFRRFPLAASTYFFGNMGRRNQFNIRAMLKGCSFYRNYTPTDVEFDKTITPSAAFGQLNLKHIKDLRVYTDYELRTDSGDVAAANIADVTIDFVPFSNDQTQTSYRDRYYILSGITRPEEFYSPDYSNAKPSKPKDYRRTLYWNPNVKLDADGKFSTTIYNNCRETRVTVSAAGVDAGGQMYYK